MRTILFYILFCILFASANLLGNQEASKLLFLSEISSITNLDEYLEVYVDKTNLLAIDDVRSANFQSYYILEELAYPYFLDYTFWTRIQIVNDLEKDTTLLISIGRFKHCEIFLNQSNQVVGEYGFGLSREKWATPISPDFYPLKLKTDKSTSIFISGKRHVENFNKKIGLSIKSTEQLDLDFQRELKGLLSGYRIQHIFFGMLIFLMIFSILALFQQQGKEYLYFLLILISAIFYFLELVQRDPIYDIYFGVYNHSSDHFNLISYIGGFSTMLFIVVSLDLKKQRPKFYISFMLLVLFFFLAFVSQYLMDIFFNLSPSIKIKINLFLRQISIIPIIICFTWLIFKDKSKLALIILFGMICLVISDVIFNFIETNAFGADSLLIRNPERILQGGFVAQSLSFVIALSIKQRMNQLEKNQTQEKLIGQLKENAHLKEKYANTLRSEVEEKSKELVLEKEKTLKSQYENELLKLESELLASQMNPHFIFNSLNSIKYYAQTKSSKDTARYITTFAKLMRMMLQNSTQRQITLSEEVKFLDKYLEVERNRSDNSFNYSIDIHGDIDVEKVNLPPMILQPYVENSIWHGILHSDREGQLRITFKTKQDFLICQIKDNGIGLKASQELNQSRAILKSKSFGTSITKGRLEKMSRLYNLEVAIDLFEEFDDNGKSKGTTSRVKIPIIKKKI